MARKRTIAPGLWENEEYIALKAPARLVWTGLWGICDRNGVFSWRPRKWALKFATGLKCVPDQVFDDLVRAGFIEKFEADGETYGFCPTWTKHQDPHPDEAPVHPMPLSPNFIPCRPRYITKKNISWDLKWYGPRIPATAGSTTTTTTGGTSAASSGSPSSPSCPSSPSHMLEKEQQQPPTPFGAGAPSAGADVAVMVVLEPPAKKPRPKSRDKRFSIAVLELPPEVSAAFDRLWGKYPQTGWDFRTKSAQPRRINRAQAAERFADVCKNVELETGDGRRLTPEDLTDAVLAWVERKRVEACRQYGPDIPPCIPCISNVFSSLEGSKKHWQEALLDFFGVAEGVS